MSSSPGRFYGMELPAEIEEDISARLVDLDAEDLVRGHLERNRQFFGVIDKSLSGFVVLDDEGDDYWLLDARDTAQVYWQDHENRDVSFFLASIQDYRSYRAEAGESEEEEDDREILAGYRPKKERASRRAVSTPELCGRYQWLVPLLAQPMVHEGKAIQGFGELAEAAAEAFFREWKSDVDVEKALQAELPTLSRDPHLAIYWLLHTTMTADDDRRDRVLKAIGDAGPELLRAFLKAFGGLRAEGDIAWIPDFRARRGRLVYYRSLLHHKDVAAGASGILKSLQIAPADLSHEKAGVLRTEVEESRLDVAALAAGLESIRTPSPGVSFLRAFLDRRAGKAESPHADAFARIVSRSEGESWPYGIAQLGELVPLVRDGSALSAACDRLEAFDPHHPALAAARLHAETLSRDKDAKRHPELQARVAFCARVEKPYRDLLKTPDRRGKIIAALEDPEVRVAVAERVLHRLKVDAPKAELLKWAFTTVVAADRPGRIDLIRRALSAMDSRSSLDALRLLAGGIDGPDHPSIEVLLDLAGRVRSPESEDFVEQMQADALMDELLGTLSPFAHHPRIFDRLMGFLERDTPDVALAKSMGARLLRSGAPKNIIGRLAPEQATRVLKALIRHILGHPNIHVRNDLGHALYQFHHPGAQAFLLEALDDAAERHADRRGAGTVLSHGQTVEEMLETVVANLYAAVRNLRTPESRTALVGRLHRERRSFWRMGNALGEIFSSEVHEGALEALRRDPQPRAVAAYAYALANFVKQSAPLLDLTREILGRPLPPQDRGLLKYALHRGMLAGLEANDFGLVRQAHAAVQSIQEPPVSPEQLEGRRKSEDPFADPETARKLDAVLSGKEDRAQEKNRRASAKAREARKPRLKISDEELGRLAGAGVLHRIFQDPDQGVLWFYDKESRFRYFDGFEVVDPPFKVVAVDGPPRLKAFLKGVKQVSDQATWWGKSGRDAVRYGDRLLLYGSQGDQPFRTGILCANEKEAKDLLDRLRACPPEGFVECKPWYVPGKGAVVREHEGFDYRFVHKGRIHWRGPAFRSNEEAFAAYQNLQLEALRDGGAQCLEIGLQANTLEKEDQTAAEWMRGRVRDDNEDILWHLRSLPELRDYVERHGLGAAIPGFSIDVGKGVPDADLRAFEKVSEHKIPGELRAAWTEFGHAEWRLGARRMRFLSPKEVLAQRDALRAGKAGLDAVGLKAAGARLNRLDALVVDGRDRVRIVLLDVPEPEGRVFAEVPENPQPLNPSNLLRWLVSVYFLLEFHDELVRVAPILKRLQYGQAFNPKESMRRFECTEKGSSKFWEVSLDEKAGTAAVRYGRIGAEGSVDTKRYADGKEAKKAVDKLIAEKLKKGYKEIDAKA